jgi:hypothetical protein
MTDRQSLGWGPSPELTTYTTQGRDL